MSLQWAGEIVFESNSMQATIHCSNPSAKKIRGWNGTGISAKDWPREKREFDTNIGKITINEQTDSANGTFIIFQGSGAPQGWLADKLSQLSQQSNP